MTSNDTSTLKQLNELKDTGTQFIAIGLYEKAVETLEEAIGIARGLSDPHQLFGVLHTYSTALRHLRRFDEALNTLREAREISMNLSQSQQMIAALDASEGQIWLEAGNPQKALPLLQSLVDLTDREADPVLWAGATINLATAQIQCGQLESALESLNDARLCYLKNFTPQRYGTVCFNLGKILLQMNRFVEAEMYFTATLWLALMQSVPELVVRALNGLAESSLGRTKFDHLFRLKEMEINLSECLREMLDTEEARIEYARRLSPMYLDAVYWSVVTGHWKRTFDFIQGARARSLLDALKTKADNTLSSRGNEPSLSGEHLELALLQVSFQVLRLEKDGELQFPESILPPEIVQNNMLKQVRFEFREDLDGIIQDIQCEHDERFAHHL